MGKIWQLPLVFWVEDDGKELSYRTGPRVDMNYLREPWFSKLWCYLTDEIAEKEAESLQTDYTFKFSRGFCLLSDKEQDIYREMCSDFASRVPQRETDHQ